MTPEQKEQLAALARAVETTPPADPWYSADDLRAGALSGIRADREFIAASNPAAILDLLEDIKRLEQERNEAYRAMALDTHTCTDNDKMGRAHEAFDKARAFVEGESHE